MSERDQTTPGLSPVRGDAPATGPAYAGSGAPGYAGAHENYTHENYTTAPEYTTRPVAFRRADALAGLLLVLAGAAAGASLALRWVHGSPATGWNILNDAFRAGGESFRSVFTLGYWQPLAILIGGAVLFVLGLLVLVPARSHRFLGLLALLVAVGVTAGVLTPLAQDRWDVDTYGIGFWVAAGVAALGLLGALKALLTGSRPGTHAAI